MDLPHQHRIPLTWLMQRGGEAIRYRCLRDLAPADHPEHALLSAAAAAADQSKLASAVIKKQKDTGTWGGNLLGLAPSAAAGIKDVGTVPQYRRLLQLGVSRTARPFKLADRILFRLLSNDPDPALLFEHQKAVKAEPAAEPWVRGQMREAAACALAEAGHVEDPRLRGAAHKIANDVSTFLRGPLAADPLVKAGKTTVLHPEAHPPTWYSVAMVAAMPTLQRERAGFTERLGHYLAQPAPKKAFVVQPGKKPFKPEAVLLGDPIEMDAKGMPKDIPLALHFIELLARLHALAAAPVAGKVLARLLRDCDEQGVWHPKNLRAVPKGTNPISYHTFPLVAEAKSAESRQVDVTFRLALIAKLLGWEVSYL